MTMIYLACPIKHTDPLIEAWRCAVATRAAASLHDAGIPVFSPATHGHGFAKLSSTRQGWDYWSRIDLPILLSCCSILVVLELDGWEQSQGVRAEIEAAEVGSTLIPVAHVKWCECGTLLSYHDHSRVCPCSPLILHEVWRALEVVRV